MRYLQEQLTLALQSYTPSGGSGGGITAGGGGGGVGSGVSLCDTTLTSLSSINVNTSMYPPSTTTTTTSSTSLTASSEQTRRTFLNQLFGAYFAGGSSSTPTTPTSPGSTETKASVTGADTETKARHRVVFMFPTRLPANTTENTLFFSGMYRLL